MIDFQKTLMSEYANSPTIVQLITNMNAYLDPSDNIDSFYRNIWNIETATGYGLDVWGRIVVVPRVYLIAGQPYLGFSGPAGPSGVTFNHGVFYNGGTLTSNYALADDPYRSLILAKALLNISSASVTDINRILIDLFGPDGVMPLPGNSYCTDGLDMTMTYSFRDPLDPVSDAIIRQSGVLPRPIGVSSTIVIRTSGLEDDAGVVRLTNPAGPGWPTSGSSGSLFTSSGIVTAASGGVNNPLAPRIIFTGSSHTSLLAFNGGDLPWSAPPVGSGILWLPGGAAGGPVEIA